MNFFEKKHLYLLLGIFLMSSCVKEEFINKNRPKSLCSIKAPVNQKWGHITPIGLHEIGEEVKVEIFMNEGYSLEGVYFNYSSREYDLPKSESNMFTSKIFSIVMKGDIEIIPIVNDEWKKRQFKRISLVDDRYWREQNRKAYNEIFPKIKHVSDQDAFYLIHMNYPAISEVLMSKTLYTNEVNYFSQNLWNYNWRDQNGDALLETEDEQKAYRIAFALADENEEIVEIYPPVYWGMSPMNFTVPCYVTVPPGKYKQKMLINTPDNRNVWIDMPLTCVIDGLSKDENNPWGYPLFHQLDVPKESWYDNSWAVKYVVDRANDNDSAPVWHNLRIYRLNWEEVVPASNLGKYPIGGDKEYEIEFFLSEYSNQRRRGKIIIMQENRVYFDPNNQFCQMKEMAYKPNKKGQRLTSYSFKVGEGIVVSGTNQPQRVKVKIIKTWGEYTGYFHEPGLVLYWQEEGKSELVQINGSGHDIINRIQKSGVGANQWWSWKRVSSKNAMMFSNNPEIHELKFANKIIING